MYDRPGLNLSVKPLVDFEFFFKPNGKKKFWGEKEKTRVAPLVIRSAVHSGVGFYR